MKRIAALSLLLALALATTSCGAKSGLRVPEFQRDASFDAPQTDAAMRDAAPTDAPMVDAWTPPDVCIELPPGRPPSELPVEFVARIESAEVFFLVDVTGSMGGEIATIQSRIVDTIAPGIAAQIPDVRFSVAHFADYPQDGYGSFGDEVFALLQRSTSDIGQVEAATSSLVLQMGGDPPEAYVEALFIGATGQGITRLVPNSSCPGLIDSVGYPCFGPNGARIILLFTDAESHNGPGGVNEYEGIVPAPHTYDETVAALREIGAKVLGIYSGDAGEGEGLRHVQALARDTGAVREDGTPLVFDIGSSGAGLDSSVIEAVRTLVEEVPIDVDVVVTDDPRDSLDITEFVRGVVTAGATPPDGAIDRGDRFDQVRPGTRVAFRILLANDRIPQTDVPQRFRAHVTMRGDRVTHLLELEVDLVVPSNLGTGCD
jgi:hypothetical protein